MKRLGVLFLAGGVAATFVACGQKASTPSPAPKANADSVALEKARNDSLAAVAAAAERAMHDSIAAAERLAHETAARRAEDSLAAAARLEDMRVTLTRMIRFDVAKASVRPNDQALLDEKLAILVQHPEATIRIVGNCDERGSDEFNIALGMRRAAAAKQYFVVHGVDAGRIEVVSNGETHPLDAGHNETAWAQNRRDEFEFVVGPNLGFPAQ